MELEPGTWIMPTVRLIRRLREGGMGSIWVAADMRLHTQVAVKFLSPALAADKNTRARFEREGRLARQIESPHLVHTYSQGVLPSGTPFIVMEWLEGESLNERLGRDGQLRPQDALSVVTQVCRALQKAHEVGVIHRDVKPDNVFVLRSDRDILVKLLDFGVAKRLDDGSGVVTDVRETLGTPMYMSPEQLRHASKVDHRTDLWAVGVLAYRMLLGTPPFDAPDFPAMCRAVCEATYEPPSRFDKRWPRALDAWFAHCFALHRDARFLSAQETASSLARALDPLGDAEPAGAIVEEDTTPA
ncbi:MAG: serine/threonine protein kinase [Deltaproteobacteria bacterium]|nr:serine/threonine protein kinase [Deltaproteobacteria bacterium]